MLKSFQNCERISEDRGANLVEHLERHATRIGGRFKQHWRHRCDQYGLGHTLRTMAPDVTRNFTAAHGVTYMDRFL